MTSSTTSKERVCSRLPTTPIRSETDSSRLSSGVHLVNLEQEDLGDQLAALFNPSKGPMTTEKTEQALKITGFYVIAVQRLFSKISSSRRASNQFLINIQQLWDYIDGAHSACQTLTGHLRAFAMAQDDIHHPANHDLLIGLRMHERYVTSFPLHLSRLVVLMIFLL